MKPLNGSYPSYFIVGPLTFSIAYLDHLPVLKTVLEENAPGEQYPSKLVNPKNGKLIWFLDRAAASALASPTK